MSVIGETKDLLADSKGRIKLHDLLLAKVGELREATSEETFPLNSPWSDKEFRERLNRYEAVTRDLRAMVALMAYWGERYHRRSLVLPLVWLAGYPDAVSGTRGFISLQWYPLLLLLYGSGIAAVAAEKYGNLCALLDTRVQQPSRMGAEAPIVLAIFGGMSHLGDAFKKIPGYEQRYTAWNDYLYNLFQGELQGAGLVDTDCERQFDRFEVLLALEHSHLNSRGDQEGGWGPPGRFVWKHLARDDGGPFRAVIDEAERQGKEWGPVKAGLFGGSSDRFRQVVSTYSAWMVKLGWH